jgi:hypothetical protein
MVTLRRRSAVALLALSVLLVTQGCSEPEFLGNPPNVACGMTGVSEAQMREAFLAAEARTGDSTRSYLSSTRGVAYDWTDDSSADQREAFEMALLDTSAFVSLAADFDDCDA